MIVSSNFESSASKRNDSIFLLSLRYITENNYFKDFSKGVKTLDLIQSGGSGSPIFSTVNDGVLFTNDELEYLTLGLLWTQVRDYFKENSGMVRIHRFESNDVWYQVCDDADIPSSLAYY